MAIAINGSFGTASQAAILQAYVADQKKSQAIMAAIKTGAPIPAWVGRPDPKQQQGGFNQVQQAFVLYEQVHGQMRFENPEPLVARPRNDFPFGTHATQMSRAHGSHNTGQAQMMSMLSQLMQAMTLLGGGFSNFMGGPNQAFQTNSGQGAMGGYQSSNGYGSGYQPAPAPPLKKGGYA
jgi:hypothetical protein